MAIRNIVQVGDTTLRKKCFEVTDFGEKTIELLNDMKETLKLANGVGLAAPQVGVAKKMLVIMAYDEKGDFHHYVLVNPKIISTSVELTYVRLVSFANLQVSRTSVQNL